MNCRAFANSKVRILDFLQKVRYSYFNSSFSYCNALEFQTKNNKSLYRIYHLFSSILGRGNSTLLFFALYKSSHCKNRTIFANKVSYTFHFVTCN